jgi:hypothetical protein
MNSVFNIDMDIAFLTFFIKFEKKLHGVKYYGKHTKYLIISSSHVKRIKRGKYIFGR